MYLIMPIVSKWWNWCITFFNFTDSDSLQSNINPTSNSRISLDNSWNNCWCFLPSRMGTRPHWMYSNRDRSDNSRYPYIRAHKPIIAKVTSYYDENETHQPHFYRLGFASMITLCVLSICRLSSFLHFRRIEGKISSFSTALKISSAILLYSLSLALPPLFGWGRYTPEVSGLG